MAWVSIPEHIPVGLSYTTGTVISILRDRIIGLTDASLSDRELRVYLNMALAFYVRNTNDPRYMETWTFNISKVTGTQYYEHDLQSIYLQTTAIAYAHRYPKTHKSLADNEFIAGNAIAKIDSILPLWPQDESPTNKMHGSARELNLENFDGVVNGTNTSYRHSVVWTVVGHKLYVYIGQNTGVAANTPEYEIPSTWQMRVRRMPILDNLESYLDEGAAAMVDRIIDCPDDAISTIVDKAAGIILSSKQPNSQADVERADIRTQADATRDVAQSQAEVARQENQRLGFTSR